ncbi:uncharacterized protein LOC122556980 [Chiloscyllium plagiosum]|uniref:uncharacterized protein LOC122556980 n=1 Tax=Chiloscyllium plagiosum TaxID=36176 RepID=UPI001CB8833E|nr:uncharacterized protein LOC122556980 [Chiloscyllium plagiosum]
MPFTPQPGYTALPHPTPGVPHCRWGLPSDAKPLSVIPRRLEQKDLEGAGVVARNRRKPRVCGIVLCTNRLPCFPREALQGLAGGPGGPPTPKITKAARGQRVCNPSRPRPRARPVLQVRDCGIQEELDIAGRLDVTPYPVCHQRSGKRREELKSAASSLVVGKTAESRPEEESNEGTETFRQGKELSQPLRFAICCVHIYSDTRGVSPSLLGDPDNVCSNDSES